MSGIRPVYVTHTEDVRQDEKGLALEAIADILKIAGVNDRVPVSDLGFWREPDYRDSNGDPAPRKSVDWYIKRSYNPERKQLCGEEATILLNPQPHGKTEPNYFVILTAMDLYSYDMPADDFLLGSTSPNKATIISFNRFRDMDDRKLRTELNKQIVYHEVGHLFGLPNRNRDDLVDNLGPHCTNVCSIRQGLEIPDDWIGFVDDRIRTEQVYCNPCTKDLRKFFNGDIDENVQIDAD